MKKKIVFIGDSHASFFSGYERIQPVYPHKAINAYHELEGIRLGSVLAYSLHKDGTSEQGREKLFSVLSTLDPKEHIVGLCFGEIDCRCHIVKQAHIQKISIEESAMKCAEKYISVIKEITALNFTIIVFNVIPTSSSTQIHNPEFPHYGTDEERELATEVMNKALADAADDIAVHFLSIYNILYKKSKRVDHFFFDGVHLSQAAMYETCRKLNRIVKSFSTLRLFKIKLSIIWILARRRYLQTKTQIKKRLSFLLFVS